MYRLDRNEMPTSFLIKDILNLQVLKPDGLCISEKQLVQCSASQVNYLCKGLPKGTVEQIKKRRRTLKNRHYANSSRLRRFKKTKQLELEVKDLRQEIVRLKEKIHFYENPRAENFPAGSPES